MYRFTIIYVYVLARCNNLLGVWVHWEKILLLETNACLKDTIKLCPKVNKSNAMTMMIL